MSDEESPIAVYESTMRELLKTDVSALSRSQMRAYIVSLKSAWKRYLASSRRIPAPSREDVDHGTSG
jgi:hypothetical protein